MESSTAIDTRLPPRSLVIGKNSSPLVKVDFIAWPSPPTREKRIFKRQRPSKDQQEVQDTSSGVFASREVQEYAADGISVMQLLLGQWHKSLARDMKYFRSFSVYGLVKLQEARNATQFLGGGVNNTVTCCSWELLTQLFSTIPPPAGPALMSVLAHLVHPLFSNVDHVLRHIANVAKKGNANVNDDLASSSTSSSQLSSPFPPSNASRSSPGHSSSHPAPSSTSASSSSSSPAPEASLHRCVRLSYSSSSPSS